MPMDPWITPTYESAVAHVKGVSVNHKREQAKGQEVETTLTGKELELFKKGKEIYARDGFCATCHQPAGKGERKSVVKGKSRSVRVDSGGRRLIKQKTNKND